MCFVCLPAVVVVSYFYWFKAMGDDVLIHFPRKGWQPVSLVEGQLGFFGQFSLVFPSSLQICHSHHFFNSMEPVIFIILLVVNVIFCSE